MLEYATSLSKLGHTVTVYTANALNFRQSDLPSEEVKDGIMIARFKFVPLPMKYSFASMGLLRALLSTDVQLLEVFSILPSFFILGAILVAKLRRIPLILYPQFHPQRFVYHPDRWVRIIGKIFDTCIAIHFIRLGDHVICLTKLEERFYRSRGIAKATTIYEWVPKRITPPNTTVLEFRNRLHLSDNEKVILFVGRIDRRKGLDILIQSMPQIISKVPNARLVVVGRDDGHLEECVNLARATRREDRITFVGPLTDPELSSAYSAADIVAIPSRFEAFGRTLIEAWTFRKPVVLTDHVALSEIVTPGSGFIVGVGSIQDLGSALVSLLNDVELREKMGEAGFRTLGTTMLDLSDVVDRTLSIYKDAIENRA